MITTCTTVFNYYMNQLRKSIYCVGGLVSTKVNILPSSVGSSIFDKDKEVPTNEECEGKVSDGRDYIF
jgi:hypothetical protein